MTVLHLIKTATGATWALRQVRELVKSGVHVHVAVPPGPLTDAYRRAGAVVHRCDLNFPINSPRRIMTVCRELQGVVDAVQPDLVHSHFVGTTLTMRLALRGHCKTPRIFQVPGPLHLEHPVSRRLELALAGAPDYWIGTCEWTCDAYRYAGVDRNRVFLAYYGTDIEDFIPVDGNRRQILARLGLAADAKIVGMVAYMYAPKRYLGQRVGLKGHEDLIAALQICRRRIPDLIGLFIGGAWDGAASYERAVIEYGMKVDPVRNKFLGTRGDVRELYESFDVAACPSHSENVGAAVESLLMQVPTVATRVGGLPDVIKDRETGWLVPPRNPMALAEAILTALSDPTRAAGYAAVGRQLARRLFDARATTRDLRAIYDQVLSRAA